MLAIEDARVNMGLEHCGQRLELDGEQRGHVLALGRGDLERGDVGMYVVRAVASLGTNVAPELLGLVPRDAGLPLSALPDLVRQTQARLARARCRRGDAVCSIRQMLRIGRWLTRQLARLGIRRRDLPEPISVGCCGGEPHGPGRGGPDAHSHPGGREKPGRLLISRPPLPYPCSPAQLGRQRRRRSATEGVELRYVHRFASDQRVFAIPRPRPRGGGTVLVDVSGSMRLDADDIARIVEDAPGSTLVAIYSGRKTSGELRIVVNDGRRAGAHQLRPYGRGNVVDQPALEWLARQRGPRVWISDGRVTGRNDRSSAAIGRACDRICRSASIQRVEDAARAKHALARTT